MTLGESISTCFKKYFVMEGRASKSEFWWFQLIWSSCFILSFIFESETVSYFLFGIIIIIPKRKALKDSDPKTKATIKQTVQIN